ncbi:MAG: hypothetical protein AMXMBFR64_51640 [Myxococcales bacterium]
MTRRIEDPEVQALAAVSATLQVDYESDDLMWEGSPFGWIKRRPSRQVGAIGEKLVAGWLAAKDFDVVRSPDSEADRLINGHRVEVKFSTLWKNGGYKFQQLRDQNYEVAICLGVSPFAVHCWVLPKVEIMRRWRANDGIQPQHGGAQGTDTAWLSVVADHPYPWLAGFGGTLSAAVRILAARLPR